MKQRRWLISLIILLIAALACGASGGDGDSPEVQSPQEEESPSSGGPAPAVSGSVETEFPLPPKYENLMNTGVGKDEINFQTPMSKDDVMAFYREEFGDKLGYHEVEHLTNITEGTFQLVFDGHPSGLQIVIQAVDLGGKTNVNIRLEEP
jgi:hypothetical protein